MKVITNEFDELMIVPTEKQFICDIADKKRYDDETNGLNPDSDEYKAIIPVYKCSCIYMANGKTFEDYTRVFMEID